MTIMNKNKIEDGTHKINKILQIGLFPNTTHTHTTRKLRKSLFFSFFFGLPFFVFAYASISLTHLLTLAFFGFRKKKNQKKIKKYFFFGKRIFSFCEKKKKKKKILFI